MVRLVTQVILKAKFVLTECLPKYFKIIISRRLLIDFSLTRKVETYLLLCFCRPLKYLKPHRQAV